MSKQLGIAKSSELGTLVNGYIQELVIITNNDAFKDGNLDLIKENLDKSVGSCSKDVESLVFADSKGDYYSTLKQTGNLADRSFFKAIMQEDKNLT